MNGVSGLQSGLPATTVIRLSASRPVQPTSPRHSAAAAEMLLTAVRNPPRTKEVCHLSALIPQVLARYGLDLPPIGPEPAAQLCACETKHEGALA